MTDKQITVPAESIHHLLKMIESRILEIGKTYYENGQSYQDDLEITALRAMCSGLHLKTSRPAINTIFDRN